MITVNGKQIIAKYLLGQAPAFATHIAAGCGPRPLETGDPSNISETVQSLDFEVFRVPIIAKGFVKEGGVEKIVFKAEMPTSQRYLVSEVGLYPAAANSVAGKYDSKLIVTFSPTEQWSYVEATGASAVQLQPDGPINGSGSVANITTTTKVQYINSDSDIFSNTARKTRQEPPRLLSKALMVSGSSSYITKTGNDLILSSSASYLQNTSLNFDLSRNNPTDQIKIAFSLASREFNENSNPDNVRIVIQFINNVANSPKATLDIDLSSSDFLYDGNPNRYHVVTKTISDLKNIDANFSLANINLIKIYTSVLVSGVPTNDYYIIYDGIRIENISTLNPLYSLVGYNLISTQNAFPIAKLENTNNYIEYRFGLGVTT